MKKIISTCIALMVSAACSISAFAMEVPTNTTIQDLNGGRGRADFISHPDGIA